MGYDLSNELIFPGIFSFVRLHGQGSILRVFRLDRVRHRPPAIEAAVPAGEDREKAISAQFGDVATVSTAPRLRAPRLTRLAPQHWLWGTSRLEL